ncbi:hypothetical protein M8C21_027904, partial [Ambrosia artemisiifolia]
LRLAGPAVDLDGATRRVEAALQGWGVSAYLVKRAWCSHSSEVEHRFSEQDLKVTLSRTEYVETCIFIWLAHDTMLGLNDSIYATGLLRISRSPVWALKELRWKFSFTYSPQEDSCICGEWVEK